MRSAFLPALVVIFLAAPALSAPQATVRTPLNTVSSGFFEQTGVNWSGNWGGIQFQFGNPGLANPTAGNFVPGTGLSTNFSITGKNFNANFGFSASQGYRQSLVGQTPVVTLTNGLPGFVSDTSQSPFVISEVPVVGNLPMAGPMNPLAVTDNARHGAPAAAPGPVVPAAAGSHRQQGCVFRSGPAAFRRPGEFGGPGGPQRCRSPPPP